MTARMSHLLLCACTSGLLFSCCFAETECYWDQAQLRTPTSRSSNSSKISPPEFGIPGFHGTATESLLEFSSAKLQELAQRGFDRISFPNVLSSWDIPVIGTVTLNLSSVLLSSLSHSSRITGIDTNAQGGIEYLIQFLTADVTCQFSLYRGIFPALRGNADLHFKDSTILYSFIPNVNSSGNLFFVSQGPPYVSIPAVGVQTSHTPLAWLYNLLLNKFGSQINRMVTAEISRSAPLQSCAQLRVPLFAQFKCSPLLCKQCTLLLLASAKLPTFDMLHMYGRDALLFAHEQVETRPDLSYCHPSNCFLHAGLPLLAEILCCDG